jgi:hypothetical protein
MHALNVMIALGLVSAGACLGIGLFVASPGPLKAFLLSYGSVVGLFSMGAAFLFFAIASVVLTLRLIQRSAASFIAPFSFSAFNAALALAGALFAQYGRV